MFKNMWRKFAAKVAQPDPQPGPSILDVLDSRGTVALDDDAAERVATVRADQGDIAAHYAHLAEIKRSAWS